VGATAPQKKEKEKKRKKSGGSGGRQSPGLKNKKHSFIFKKCISHKRKFYNYCEEEGRVGGYFGHY
jgi:hypothetical protein